MTEIEVDETPPPAPDLNARLLFALRQAALLSVALLIAGLVTERLRPVEVLDRGIASTPFLWAIVAWAVVLLINALAFDRSQMNVLEQTPLLGGVIAGAIVFLTGLVSLDGGTFARRLMYLLANSLGALMFWWALLSIVALVMRRLASDERATP